MKRSPLERRTPLARRTLLTADSQLARRSAPTRRRAVSPASAAQRAKVRDAVSIVSGEHGCDPAHIVSRSLGGCDDALCVVPLTRQEHEAYDRGELDLLPYLIAHGLYAEVAHAVIHARGDLLGLAHIITGVRWAPDEEGSTR